MDISFRNPTSPLSSAVSISSVSPLLWSNNVPLAFYSGVGDLDHRVGGFTGLSRLVINDLYWGIAPGTPTAAGDGVPLEPDEEHMTRTGPIRFTGGMELARTSRVGTCTLCSELGCDHTVVEEFPGERFTSSVSQGAIVCLMERGLTPPGDSPVLDFGFAFFGLPQPRLRGCGRLRSSFSSCSALPRYSSRFFL